MRRLAVLLSCAAIGLFTSAASAIINGQIDDFQDGTVQNWMEGIVSPNQPFNLPDSGPGGVGDNSLQNFASGAGGAGGRVVMFNQSQWTGDYLAAGVDTINGFMRADPAGADLLMRVTLQGFNAGEVWSSTNAIPIPNDGVWYPVSFGLTAADLTQVSGVMSLDNALANASELRILSSTAPSFIGEIKEATLGVDNLQALPEPTTAALLGLGAATLLRRRRMRRC